MIVSGRTRRIAKSAAAWIGVSALYVLTLGLRRLAAGVPMYQSWEQVAHAFTTMLVGGLLAPFVYLALRRLRSRRRHPIALGTAYVAIGISFWLGWSLLRIVQLRLLFPARFAASPLEEQLLQALVFSALIALTLYTAMAVLINAIWYRDLASRKEIETATLRLQLEEAKESGLRSRIDIRSLEESFAIASDLMESNVQSARRVLSDLSELLRVALGRNGHRELELGRELELARRVVAIQNARHAGSIETDLHVDPLLHERPVLPLVLQPLLNEGFRWIDHYCPTGGRIQLDARDEEGGVVLAITATCRVDPGENAAAGGAGDVATLRARLVDLFGDRAEVAVDGSPARIEIIVAPKAETPHSA